MKLFTLFADLTLNTAGFATQVVKAKADGKSLAEAIGADSESIKASFSDAFSFAAGDLLADAVREGLRAMGEFVGESIGVASDLEETNSKIDAIFGSMSRNVHNWARTTKDQFGIGEFAAKGYAGQLASLLSADSLEMTTEQIYEMSTGLVELAGDLASFHNMSFDVVWTKLLSGMRGETEAIEDLGVDVRASAMAAYLGIKTDDWGKLDQKTRTLTTYEYILKNTTVAQGDFVRTQDQYANQMRIFNENITQLKTQLGEGLLPVMTDLVTWFNSLFGLSKSAGDTVGDIRDEYTSTWVEIESTAASALKLVEALSDLEEGGLTDEEQSQWDALVQRLKEDVPGIAAAIAGSTDDITAGSEAMKQYILDAKEMQLEVARLSSMEKYNAELGKLEVRVAEDQIAAEQARYEADALTSLYNQTLINAAAYERSAWGKGPLTEEYTELLIGSEEDFRDQLLTSLYELSYGAGDEQAQAFINVLEGLVSPEEAEKAAADAEAKYQDSLQKWQELKLEMQTLTAAIEALANQEPPTVVVNVNNSADKDLIVSEVEHHLSTSAKNKSLTTGD